MAGILTTTSFSRRRAMHIGAGAVVSTMAGLGTVAARQNANEYTFIVAGLDYREGFDEHNNDVLMISRVNTELGSVRTVSIPRDLYVEIPGYGYDKITRSFHDAFYANNRSWEAGAQSLTDTISANFGIVADGVATTDFEGFVRIIDTLGGVEVNNPYEVIDAENEANEPGKWTWPAGPQTLDGASTLRFVRTRHMDGDDGRAMRQQLVLAAILEELQSPDVVTKIPGLIDALRDAVETNIPAEVQMQLVAAIPSISMDNVFFTLITDQLWGGTLDTGMWVYQGDWSTLPGVVQGYLAGQ